MQKIITETAEDIEAELDEDLKILHKRMLFCRTPREAIKVSAMISKLIKEATDRVLSLNN